MIHFKPGSQVWQLITLLSFVGEIPIRSLQLLGSERVYRTLINKLTTVQTFNNALTGDTMTCRLLSVSGKGNAKTVRLFKYGLPILTWVHPNAYDYYMESFHNHRFPGDAAHKERNHRVSEAAMLCMRAGFLVKPYCLPKLQNESLLSVIPSETCLYLAKDLKKVGEVEMSKTMFTRMVGALFTGPECYALYNTRDAVMKWSGMGEFKTLHSLTETARMNAGINRIDSAILYGQSGIVALKTLLESEKSRHMEFRFDSIYRHIHFISMDGYGIRQLRILSVPDWNEKLLDLLFEPEDRSYNKGLFEYDAYVNGVYILSHLDGDIARLIRFKEAVQTQTGQFEVLCFPHQMHFLREYLEPHIAIKTIAMDTIEAELGSEMEENI